MLNRRERQTPNYVSQSVKDFEYSKRKRRPRSKLTKNPRKTTSLTKLRKSWPSFKILVMLSNWCLIDGVLSQSNRFKKHASQSESDISWEACLHFPCLPIFLSPQRTKHRIYARNVRIFGSEDLKCFALFVFSNVLFTNSNEIKFMKFKKSEPNENINTNKRVKLIYCQNKLWILPIGNIVYCFTYFVYSHFLCNLV